jgi:hypothetical protein
MGREERSPERFLPRLGSRWRLSRQDPPGENLPVVHRGEADPADPLPDQALLGGGVDPAGPKIVKASEKDGELPRRDVLRDPQRRDVPEVEHFREVRNQGLVTPEEAIPEEHPVPRDAEEEHPGRLAAGLPGEGRPQRVDSPGEDRMPGSVQAGPMVDLGDVEQEPLDPLRLRIVKVIHRLEAPLPYCRIAYRKGGGKSRGKKTGGASPREFSGMR